MAAARLVVSQPDALARAASTIGGMCGAVARGSDAGADVLGAVAQGSHAGADVLGAVAQGSHAGAAGVGALVWWFTVAIASLALAWLVELRHRGKSRFAGPGVSAASRGTRTIPQAIPRATRLAIPRAMQRAMAVRDAAGWGDAVGRGLLLVLAGLVGGSCYLAWRLSWWAAVEPLVGRPCAWRGTVIGEPVVRDGRLEMLLRGAPSALGPGGVGWRAVWSGGPERQGLEGREQQGQEGRGQEHQEGRPVLTVLARVKNWGAQVLPRTGDLLTVSGELVRPNPPRNPGEFDYAGWLRAQGVAAILYADGPGSVVRCGPGRLGPVARGAAWLRTRFLAAVRAHLPARQGAVVEGMVLGVRSGLSPELEESFRRSGLTHLLAVSGSNVALVAGVTRALLAWAGVRTALAGAIAGTWVFAATASGGASVGRAALMATLMLAAKLAGRPSHPLNSLAAAVLVLTVLNPSAWEDPGFWLSVAATAGILGWSGGARTPASRVPAARAEHAGGGLLRGGPGVGALPRGEGGGGLLRGGPGVGAMLWGDQGIGDLLGRGVSGAREVLAVTCSAQAAVLPISLYYFQQACLVAPLSNLLVFPLVGAVTVGGLLSAACAGVHAALGWVFHPLGMLVEAVIRLAGFWAAIPGAAVTLPAPRWPHLLLYYVFLGWWWGWLRWPLLPRRGPWTGPRLALAGLVVVVGTALVVVAAAPRHVLQAVFFSVGQGDAILLWRPGGPVMLVDCGPARETYDAGADTVVPYLHRQGIRRVDLMVLTHGHGDHVGGAAAVLDAVRVHELWLGPEARAGGSGQAPGPDAAAYPTARYRRAPGLEVVVHPEAGYRKVLAPGWEVEVLHPPQGAVLADLNDASLVLLVKYGGIRLLLAADVEKEGEALLLHSPAGRPPEVDLLKVPHHGGPAACGDQLLRVVRPRHAVVQVGPNPFGHPAPETLRRLERTGARLWRTDVQGAVVARTDGRRLTVTCMIPGAP